MGVIYIGDRSSGKTHLALELANPYNQYVKVSHPDYESLKSILCKDGETRPTLAQCSVHQRAIELNVKLPAGLRTISVDWLDTSGEIWRRYWQAEKLNEWQQFLQNIRQAQGILLVMPPYRQIILPQRANPEDFITQKQWCNRFASWVRFFRQDCPTVRHLILCLNKADLFCSDPDREAHHLAYHPMAMKMSWQQRDNYIVQGYFRPIVQEIIQLNKSIQGLSVRCFITSIYQRELLELPWIYLGSHLAQ